MRRAALTSLIVATACAGGTDADLATTFAVPGETSTTSGEPDAATTSGAGDDAEMTSTGTPAGAVCGNEVVEGDELCDGLDHGGLDCTDFGFEAGALACDPECQVITEACSSCGDGVVSLIEACDGTAFNGATCTSLGFGSGNLACAADCSAVDTSGCMALPTCGNGVLDPVEQCDGADLGGVTCQSQGFDMGSVTCTASCTVDVSGCSNNPLDCIGNGQPCLLDPDNPASGCCPPGVEGNTFGVCALLVCV